MKPSKPHGRARKQRRPRGIDWGREVGRWVAGRWAKFDHVRGQLEGRGRVWTTWEVGRFVAGRWACIDHPLVTRGWTRRVDPTLLF